VFPSLAINDVVTLTQPPGDSSYWFFTTREGIIGRFANTPDVSSWETVADLRGDSGVIPRDRWLLSGVDSEEQDSEENGAAANAFDGDPLTFWHTEWFASVTAYPHWIEIDLGAEYDVDGFRYLPRQDQSENGRIADYEFYVSADGVNWGEPVSSGVLANTVLEQELTFPAKTGRYVRLVGLSEVNENPWASAAEINVLGVPADGGVVTVTYDGGLIQLVFHPDYPSDPRVFVNYTTTGSHNEPYDIIVSSFDVMPNGKRIKKLSEKILITQPRGTFHQGGFIAFKNDGYLYLGIGDGAPQQDPDNNAQNLMDLRGNVLRLDVDNVPSGEVYVIPADNPFSGNPRCGPVSNSAPCPEIFASGFRNPFRGDIDPVTGDIWIADVGFTSREEIDKVIKGGNYGWNVFEGTQCREYSGSCADTGLIEPVVEFSHENGQCAVIGGYVYRGNSISELQGRYLFADFCTSKISAVQYDLGGNAIEEVLMPGGSGIGNINTFARDNDGEHYVVTGSEVYKIVDDSGGGASTTPALLSQTGCFDATDPTIPASGLIPYDINSGLWTDGASKRRWMALPDGDTVDIDVDGDFLFPVGTVLVKEFAYDDVPHETRLFVRHMDGIWTGYSYEWREDGSDADLLPAGKVKVLPTGHSWTYPSRAECLRCHNDTANFSLGPEMAQLNREMLYPQSLRIANQLETLEHIGIFTYGLPASIEDIPAYAELDQTHHSVDYRARSYLHSNCSGCHRPGEITQAPMDLSFSSPTTASNLCDVTPAFGDLGVVGAKILSPGNPDLSVLKLRDESRDPLIQMPPLGTAIVHNEWISLLESWISDPTLCEPDSDPDSDGVFNKLDNCPDASNASQRDTDRNGIGDACELTANAGVDQFLQDLDENGIEQVSLDGSASTSPGSSDPISTWTWRKDGVEIASGESTTVSLPAGTHTIELEIETDGGSTDVDTLVVTFLVDTDSDGILDILDNDDDNDGLSDADEETFGTNPLLYDTDSDGLSDAAEVGYDGDISQYTPGQDTDPLLPDTDGDGYTDSMDPIPLTVNLSDGDLAPWANPDGQLNAADVLIATQLVLGQRTADTLQYVHGDMNVDGIIDLADLLLIQQSVLQ
jgi:uncharacterized repeat protein (TIGR03806 family)